MASLTAHRFRFTTAIAALSIIGATTRHADACGGFFCGQQPVDQTAERILFEVGPDTVTMTTQIAFSGDAADFAWVLPLGEVPLADSLAVYHQQALNALDTNSGPLFRLPQDSACSYPVPPQAGGIPVEEDSGASEPPPVQVYIREEVGEYDVAVIGSEDPTALITWLRDEGYRVTPVMEPYIERYTSEGLKFLALKLLVGADVQNLSPFRFTLPGTTPTIPLRMTAVAAEPEMSILAFVLADERFEGKNWPNLAIADDQIRYNPFGGGFNVSTNWPRLVAQAVDDAGGQGWVTEFAGPSESYAALVRAQVENGNFATEDDAEAAADLLAAFEAHPYLTRLYTRVSAEEMTSDPVFGRSSLGDVDREHQLSRIVGGIDQCASDVLESTDPCDFATCGAGGLCRTVRVAAPGYDATNTRPVAACACVPGATARVTFAPDGSTTVICQDERMSFLNAGDRELDSATVLPDACAGFDCGEHGQCSAMNLTPTCVCDAGYVAVGNIDSAGVRSIDCVEPEAAVPGSFYDKRLPALPAELPGGREVDVPVPEPRASSSSGGCALSPVPRQRSLPSGWLVGLLGVPLLRRRRR